MTNPRQNLRKQKLKRRSLLPFKESATRFGETCVVEEPTTIYAQNDQDDIGFTPVHGSDLDVGDVLIPLELVRVRMWFAIRCVTRYGVVFVRSSLKVKRLQ